MLAFPEILSNTAKSTPVIHHLGSRRKLPLGQFSYPEAMSGSTKVVLTGYAMPYTLVSDIL